MLSVLSLLLLGPVALAELSPYKEHSLTSASEALCGPFHIFTLSAWLLQAFDFVILK